MVTNNEHIKPYLHPTVPTLMYPAPPSEEQLRELMDSDQPQLVETAWDMIAKVPHSPPLDRNAALKTLDPRP